MRIRGADVITEVLIEQGVDTVFGYPGGAVLEIYDALYKHRGEITHHITAHEQGAAHAADGFARATGKTGVVIATSGPGATNLVTGIATAYMDSVPMVAITGNVGSGLIGKDSFQEVYTMGITMPITKHNYMVQRAEDIAPTLREAFRIAGSGRKGPVLVDITKDATINECDYLPQPGFVEEKAPPENDEAVWEVLVKADATPCGLGARDTLRLEAGFPLYGHELTESTNPLCTPFAWVVKDKPFHGRERMWGVSCARRLVGLRMTERGIPRQGYKVMSVDGEVVGEITSGTLSPLTRDCIGFAWVDPELAQEGSNVEVEVRGRGIAATVVTPPFYQA